MSASSKPRIVKDSGKKRHYTASTYRKALPELLVDFQRRCAYSLQHIERMGVQIMEIDHHNPRLQGRRKHHYRNLVPAHRICNGHKSDTWPTRAQFKKKLRFLNPRKEVDYGAQIFEDSESCRLIGTTPAAKYHIRHCGLNDPYFVQERKTRASIRKRLDECYLTMKENAELERCYKVTEEFSKLLQTLIPAIPEPPSIMSASSTRECDDD